MENGYVYIADNIFSTLLAISNEEQMKGLMHKPFPPPIMSFIYKNANVNKFWMKNTPSPLDIVFCHNGIVNQICNGIPLSTRIIGGDKLSDLIIEFPFGTVEKCGVSLGNSVGLVKPTEAELEIIIAKKYGDY